MRNYKDPPQKMTAQHFLSTENKELPPQNSISAKISFSNKGEIRAFSDEGNLTEFAINIPNLNERPKNVLFNREKKH